MQIKDLPIGAHREPRFSEIADLITGQDFEKEIL